MHSPSSYGAEPGFGTMSSNQGAGRGRFGGSLSPDHCLTHQTQWRAEWRARQGGGAAGDNNGILHSNLPSINWCPSINFTLLKNGNPFIEKCSAHSARRGDNIEKKLSITDKSAFLKSSLSENRIFKLSKKLLISENASNLSR